MRMTRRRHPHLESSQKVEVVLPVLFFSRNRKQEPGRLSHFSVFKYSNSASASAANVQGTGRGDRDGPFFKLGSADPRVKVTMECQRVT